jgi:ATP-dependent helicase/nuclease subunit A
MSQLKVIRASAGSGKTYRITSDYLHLLFRYPGNFRHILAVTFTNKATEEMKSRIIDELYTMSIGNHSSYAHAISRNFNLSLPEIQQKASAILNIILHNYSRFYINTIDSFFLNIIKSFSREIGLQFNFAIELDTETVLEKAADQMLLKIENDKVLLDWLVHYAEERIESGKHWDFKNDILKLGKQIFNERFKSLPASFHKNITNRNLLLNFQKQLQSIKRAFESKLIESGRKGMAIIAKHDIGPFDFKYKDKGSVGKFFLELSQGELSKPGKRVVESAESAEKWLPDDQVIAGKISAAAQDGLLELLQSTIQFYNENCIRYNSAVVILSDFYTLGLLSDLSDEVSTYTAKKNLFVLANAGILLRTVIGENDAPFIYEKAGQILFHFMIDEFQDTSVLQWQNFKPLVSNSLSQQNNCMLVGDVKQSIYRWRNSDWKIMADQIESTFPEYGIRFDELNVNWRSKANIVAFNNSIFSHASKRLQQLFIESDKENVLPVQEKEFLSGLIEKAYSGCMQNLPSNRKLNEGCVKIQFVKNNVKDWKSEVLSSLPGILDDLQKHGHRLKDIAFLVRYASEGREIVDYLNDYNSCVPKDHPYRYTTLSNESAFLNNSLGVRFIIKLFRYLVYPLDEINTCSLLNDYLNYITSSDQESNKQKRLIVDHTEIFKIVPPEFIDNIDKLRFIAPLELLEQLVMIFKLNQQIADLPFLQTFTDVIADYQQNNTASISGFLEYWEIKKDSASVCVSDDQDAIRVMTIHKSKGLEFANVIIPFCNWNIDHKLPLVTIWCPVQQEPFNQLEFVPVRYSSKLQNTIFAGDYFLEKVQTYVDNLNLMYVAFTRSIDNLVVFSPLPDKQDKLTNTGELLYDIFRNYHKPDKVEHPSINISDYWNEPDLKFNLGTFASAVLKEKTGFEELKLETYFCGQLKGKLQQHYRYSDFWNISNENRPSVRTYGNMMHQLFQEIKKMDDIEKAVDLLVSEGLIEEKEKSLLVTETRAMLAEKPFSDWFGGNWKIINETGIIVPNEHMYRPDRVMIKEKHAIVVDYKFGKVQSAIYNKQVKNYSKVLKEMGFSKVEGYVWYVNLNLLEKAE